MNADLRMFWDAQLQQHRHEQLLTADRGSSEPLHPGEGQNLSRPRLQTQQSYVSHSLLSGRSGFWLRWLEWLGHNHRRKSPGHFDPVGRRQGPVLLDDGCCGCSGTTRGGQRPAG